jgi:hypothetical protein
LRKSGVKEKGDERILGSGEFVSEVIRNVEGKRVLGLYALSITSPKLSLFQAGRKK